MTDKMKINQNHLVLPLFHIKRNSGVLYCTDSQKLEPKSNQRGSVFLFAVEKIFSDRIAFYYG